MSFAQLAVGIVDCLKQVLEARRVIDWPKATKAMAEQLHLTLGKQPDSNDPFLRQNGAPTF